MAIDAKIIKRKIILIERDLKKLKKIQLVPYKDYIKDSDLGDLAERNLERIIGRLIDINYHILSQEKEIMPNDYYSSFIEMGKQGYLPDNLAESMANSAGLRNRLAHEYDEIDGKKVYEAAGRAIKEVPKYLAAVLGKVDKSAKQNRLV